MTEPIKMSFIKAVQKYFSEEESDGRKVTIPEFKELTTEDKHELSKMLNEMPGYEHEPYTDKSN